MPQIVITSVGTAKRTVSAVSTFMVMFRLLLMMEANASVVLLIMSR